MAIPDYMSDLFGQDEELESRSHLGKRKSPLDDDEWPEARVPISMSPPESLSDPRLPRHPGLRHSYDGTFSHGERFPPRGRFPPPHGRFPPPHGRFPPHERLSPHERLPPPHGRFPHLPPGYRGRYPPHLPPRGLPPPMLPPTKPRIKPNKRKFYIGQEVKAHWEEGKYEHAIIQDETQMGYMVVFSEFGESYEIEDTDIRRYRKEELGPGNYWCDLCQVETGCAKTLLTHIVGKKHQKKLQEGGDPEKEVDLGKVHEGVKQVGGEGEDKLVSDLKEEATALSRLWYKCADKNLIHNISVIEEEGEPHSRVFTATCVIGGEVVGLGSAANKKQARQRAAISALKVIESMQSRPRTSEDRERWAAMSKFYRQKRSRPSFQR